MAEPILLHEAASQLGKSEITLRRLISSGKVPVIKEKTLNGFVFKVDIDQVADFYVNRNALVEAESAATPEISAIKKPIGKMIPIKLRAPVVPVPPPVDSLQASAEITSSKSRPVVSKQQSAPQAVLANQVGESESQSHLVAIMSLSVLVIILLAVGAYLLLNK